jgi:hypothetical protein
MVMPTSQPDTTLMNFSPDASAWRAACKSYSEQARDQAAQRYAPYFEGFGALHVCVAELLRERDEEWAALGERRVVHIDGAAGLLAAYSPSQRVVQVRAYNFALEQIEGGLMLNARVLPSSAGLLEGAASRGFKAWPVAALFWYDGQASLTALDHVPALAQQRLHIRRFPALEPSALLLRQLHLIHILSQYAPSFDQLMPLLREDGRAFVCPDLASLYLTGMLRIGQP